ncbi:hypothetical protein ACFWY9_27875 [Amycolatopsis sp. NPDC059027]|uniref:hypothetical protein n=1 Tax=unclassified Amycolatopsis TaxID=2618356 RepID=UPI00366ACF91
MFWLFAQIWLWLLVAFLLGMVVTWLLMRAAQRRETSAEAAYAEPEPEPDREVHETHEPAPHAAEETQYIPQAAYAEEDHGHHEDDYHYPPDEYSHDEQPHYLDEEPDVPEPEGHREGQLPASAPPHAQHVQEEPAWPAADDWPSEHQDGPTPDGPSPRSHQPGRRS